MDFAETQSSPTSPDHVPEEINNNEFQPFFVLHKATPPPPPPPPRKASAKTKKRIEMNLDSEKGNNQPQLEADYQSLQIQAFHAVWSKIDSSIKEVLRQMNVDVFDKVHCWIRESFDKILSTGMPRDRSKSYPHLIPRVSTANQLFTGFVFTQNMEFVDDLQTFADLALYLKSRGCHVANLSSSDFSGKNGVGGCLRSLLRQFLAVGVDAAEISTLASWYSEQGNHENPVVVIIDDLERCCKPVLSDLIITLSEWVVKIPVILILGVATTFDAPRNIFSSNVLNCLVPSKFIVQSPIKRMDSIVETVLVKCCASFSIGHKVATFLRNHFLRQDGTLTSFIKALKIAVVQHFLLEPPSVALKALVDVEERKDSCADNIALLSETMVKKALEVHPHRNCQTEPSIGVSVTTLAELNHLRKLWSSVAMCLYEAGKYCEVSLLDLYSEMLDPNLYNSHALDHHSESRHGTNMPLTCNCLPGLYPSFHQVICKVRDLPAVALCQLLKRWDKLTEGFADIHQEVKELQSLITLEKHKRLKTGSEDLSIHALRSSIRAEQEIKSNGKVAMLMSKMIRSYMQPIECIPFHDMVCFQEVGKLQSALIGDPRRRIQLDLLDCHKFVKCNCCSKKGSTMHDTSIMYILAQEHGDLINLHDWFQSFKATISQPATKGKHKLKQQSSPKGKRICNAPQHKSDASLQARFCRAIIELQLAGLLRMPSKRRPDYVQRVAFGL